ncbi:MAG TPA: STAS domain-containing protein [Candidatus Kapabacteria bacterium]|nr:STAS domain-containing protein [Candidatus Kapabacteria bacterium]
MTSTITKEGNLLKVGLKGDLTGGAEAMRFAKLLREEITTTKEIKQVVINMAAVGFVDSSGLGMLLGAREAAETVGAHLSIEEPNVQFTHLLELTKLSEVLGVKK